MLLERLFLGVLYFLEPSVIQLFYQVKLLSTLYQMIDLLSLILPIKC